MSLSKCVPVNPIWSVKKSTKGREYKAYLCGAEDNQLDSLSALHSSHFFKRKEVHNTMATVRPTVCYGI